MVLYHIILYCATGHQRAPRRSLRRRIVSSRLGLSATHAQVCDDVMRLPSFVVGLTCFFHARVHFSIYGQPFTPTVIS